MRFTSFHRFLMIAALSVALGWAQQGSQGEMQRQNKTNKKAKIVITDDDVVHSNAPGAYQSTADSASAGDGKTSLEAAPDAKPKGPAAPQSKDPKVNELRQKVE